MDQKSKLFHKDFILVLLGQIISLFGNAIIRFALPLYLFNMTNSSVIYGVATACSFIPMIVLTPMGGMIADRVNKRNIMVILDFSTAGIILLFQIFLGRVDLVVLLITTLMILYGIQGVYQPTVQASIPLLASEKNLITANACINQVNALSGLLGPALGGILFSFYGLRPILVIGGICFFSSAVMELFIVIPFKKNKENLKIKAMIKHDFKESMHFIQKEKPVLWKGIGIVSAFNLFLSSLIIISSMVIIKDILNMPDQMYGYAQAVQAAGGLCGGIFVGIFANKLKINKVHILLLLCSLTLVPIGVVLLLQLSSNIVYIVLMLCCFMLMAVASMFSIQLLTFIQGQTPAHLVGKVISWVLALSMCSQPIGNALYGYLFKIGSELSYLIIFGAAFVCVIIAICSKKIFGMISK